MWRQLQAIQVLHLFRDQQMSLISFSHSHKHFFFFFLTYWWFGLCNAAWLPFISHRILCVPVMPGLTWRSPCWVAGTSVLCCGRTLQLQQTDLESWALEASACSEGLCGQIILLRFLREKWMLLHTAAVGFTSENKWERLPNPGCSEVP